MRYSRFEREFHDSFFHFHFFMIFSFVFKRGVPPAEQPFIVEDMPQMHRFVYDYYSHYVESLKAQREVWLTVKHRYGIEVDCGQSQDVLVTQWTISQSDIKAKHATGAKRGKMREA